MKHLLTTTAIVSALALAACAQPIGAHRVGQPMLNDDGRSWTSLVSSETCVDANANGNGNADDSFNPLHCWTANNPTAFEFTHYVWNSGQWVWTTEQPQARPATAPAAGLAAAQIIVPAAATLGAGALINVGEQAAARINALGTGLGDEAIGKGLAAQKPAQIGISNVNGNYNVNGAYATGGSANAAANAAQSQSISVPSSLTIKPSSLP